MMRLSYVRSGFSLENDIVLEMLKQKTGFIYYPF